MEWAAHLGLRETVGVVPGSHQVTVVAMHHTFDTNHVVPDKQMDNHPDVLIVNCLFFDNKGLLSCKCNKESRKKVCKKLELKRMSRFSWNFIHNGNGKKSKSELC
ncbi:uncharacterized protein KZ484_003330 isoform 2-T2 [Pholidichthys leucotaenia]